MCIMFSDIKNQKKSPILTGLQRKVCIYHYVGWDDLPQGAMCIKGASSRNVDENVCAESNVQQINR